MKIATIDIPEDHGYLIPLGDLHRGDRHLTARGLGKLKGYLDWVMDRENAYIFLMGDILNVASRQSKTNPFESMSGNDEYDAAIKLFNPYKDRIIGAITGNHEQRMYKDYGFNPLGPFCNELNIPYCGFSSCIKIRVGRRKEAKNQFQQVYWGFAHHGNGGGGTLGAAINRKVKLQEIVHGMDFYMAGHDHQLVAGSRNVLLPKRDTIEHQRVHYIDTGSFLDWDGSYAEEAAMAISKLGAPRLRFDGRENHHDLHVSI
jgi:hypothetical protein